MRGSEVLGLERDNVNMGDCVAILKKEGKKRCDTSKLLVIDSSTQCEGAP
jgi:hypothetical protein